jgi:hypothetical protein
MTDTTIAQPLHTLYAGAHLYRADAVTRIGQIAQQTLHEYDVSSWLDGVGGAVMWHRLRDALIARLSSAPVEDQRIDFEDGYGPRGDEEEDAHAKAVGIELARAQSEQKLPRLIGIRLKSAAYEARAQRTFRCVLHALREAGGTLPDPFIVTLPKVVAVEEVERWVRWVDQAAVDVYGDADRARDRLRFELMIEHPRALLDVTGRVPLTRFAEALGSRALALHLGAYDLLAEQGVLGPSQRLSHPLLEHARATLLAAMANTPIWVVDGATATLPVRMHKNPKNQNEEEENRRAMEGALRLHVAEVTRALESGIHQGWDLHPNQCLARYAAVYAYYFKHEPAMRERLEAFHAKRAQATRVGTAFDDAATARAIESFFTRFERITS